MVTGRESGGFSRRLFIHGLFFSSFLFSRHLYVAFLGHGRNASWVMDIGKAYIAITLPAQAGYGVLFSTNYLFQYDSVMFWGVGI